MRDYEISPGRLGVSSAFPGLGGLECDERSCIELSCEL